MKIISTTIQNLAILPNGKIGRCILTTKPVEIKDLQGLKYIPQQLSEDVVEISQRYPVLVSKDVLQSLVSKKLTLQEISNELNVPTSTIRHYLKRYDISRFPEEITALKKYFSTTDLQEKAKAYEVIDKRLQKIAKKEAEIRKEPFDDCLQDVRLRFLEHASKKGKNKTISAYTILDMVKDSVPVQPEKIEKVGLRRIANKIGVTDKTTEMFEDSDCVDFLLNNSKLTSREKSILEYDMRQEVPMVKTAAVHQLGTERVRQIRKESFEKIKERHFTKSGIFQELVNPINSQLLEQDLNLLQISNNYYRKIDI